MNSTLRRYAGDASVVAFIVCVVGFLLSSMFATQRGRMEVEADRYREERIHTENQYKAAKIVLARAVAHSDSVDKEYKELATKYQAARSNYTAKRNELLGSPTNLSDTLQVKETIALADAAIAKADSMKAGADTVVAAASVVKAEIPNVTIPADEALAACARENAAIRKLIPGRTEKLLAALKWSAGTYLVIRVIR